jgi:hypothetical protein
MFRARAGRYSDEYNRLAPEIQDLIKRRAQVRSRFVFPLGKRLGSEICWSQFIDTLLWQSSNCNPTPTPIVYPHDTKKWS